jgi:hypothetical protein
MPSQRAEHADLDELVALLAAQHADILVGVGQREGAGELHIFVHLAVGQADAHQHAVGQAFNHHARRV